MDWNPLKWPIFCIAGVLFVAIFLIFTFIAFLSFPLNYSPLKNWVSDLGNNFINPKGAIFFNVGCILTGIAFFPYILGLHKWYNEDTWRLILLIFSQVIGFFIALTLILIGIFPVDQARAHIFLSNLFFIFNFTFILFTSISLLNHPDFIRPICYIGFAVTGLYIVPFFILNNSLLEWIIVLASFSYFTLITYNMFKITFPS